MGAAISVLGQAQRREVAGRWGRPVHVVQHGRGRGHDGDHRSQLGQRGQVDQLDPGPRGAGGVRHGGPQPHQQPAADQVGRDGQPGPGMALVCIGRGQQHGEDLFVLPAERAGIESQQPPVAALQARGAVHVTTPRGVSRRMAAVALACRRAASAASSLVPDGVSW